MHQGPHSNADSNPAETREDRCICKNCVHRAPVVFQTTAEAVIIHSVEFNGLECTTARGAVQCAEDAEKSGEGGVVFNDQLL